MKTLFSSFAVLSLAATVIAAPSVSNVSLSQGGNGIVKITYDLGVEPGIVLLDIQTNGVSIGDAKITHVVGDVNRRLEPGAGKTIWWSCSKDAPEVDGTAISAVVTAYSLEAPPDVMVLDLVITNRITFCKSLEGLPDGGLKNDIYRTSKLVMKKVPAKGVTFLCGSSAKNPSAKYKPYLATFTYDYYLGIYPVTQGQQKLIDGQAHSQFTSGEDAPLRPVDNYLWGNIRNWKAWPGEYGLITPTMDCSIGKLRRFGLVIDLPTSTEWEYACRAGKWTRFGNGTDDEAGMDRMGWYGGNSGGTTHPVGRKDPNDWGFYDMHGNVFEWCLDKHRDFELEKRTETRVNYPGESETSSYIQKTLRGGSRAKAWNECASHIFFSAAWDDAAFAKNYSVGYRVCVKAVIP